MYIPRIYYPHVFSPGLEIELPPAASAHLLRVLRMEVGDILKLFDGNGVEYAAKISKLTKHAAIVVVTESLPTLAEPPIQMHLGQGISRGEKMDYTLQKAVELGVREITPLWTARSGVKLTSERVEKRMEHWLGVIISAAEQCGRSVLPILHAPVTLDKWVETVAAHLRLVLDPGGTLHLRDCVLEGPTIALLVGPESGFSSEEIVLAEQHKFGKWRLGPRILRTETAAPAAIVALQCLWGDMV